MKDNVLVFDIETIGKTLDAYLFGVNTVDYLKNKLKKKRKTKGDERSEGEIERDFAAVDVDLARVICIGTYLVRDTPEGVCSSEVCFTTETVPEEDMIHGFIDYITKEKPTHVISFNGRNFDVPILARKAALYGLFSPYLSLARNKRHIDLADYLGGYGGRNLKTLDFYCDLFRIGKEGCEFNGCDIRKLYDSGNWGGIRKKCCGDVKSTYELYAKLKGFLHENQ